jgi:hypothetical protein
MKLKNSLPIKYHVGAHRICLSYPTETDALYDIIEHVVSSNKRKKTWKAEDFKIQLSDMKLVFSDMSTETIKTILTTLHKNNDIAMSEGEQPGEYVVAVTQQGISKIYEM